MSVWIEFRKNELGSGGEHTEDVNERKRERSFFFSDS